MHCGFSVIDRDLHRSSDHTLAHQAEQLLQRADKALYGAKRAGHNRVEIAGPNG